MAHLLADGSSAGGTWTTEIARHTVGWRCECSCGWTGPVHDSHGAQSPTDEQVDAMMDADWDAGHARPLLPLAGLDELARARAGGVSWEQIGRVLGVSRQAAWERFGAGERAAPAPVPS